MIRIHLVVLDEQGWPRSISSDHRLYREHVVAPEWRLRVAIHLAKCVAGLVQKYGQRTAEFVRIGDVLFRNFGHCFADPRKHFVRIQLSLRIALGTPGGFGAHSCFAGARRRCNQPANM